jgi:carbon-monoxide dehydrogenase medium subunit
MHRVLLPFEFDEPTAVGEVVALVDGRGTRVLAGGVDLVLKMRLRQVTVDRVVSLQKVPGLDYVRVDGEDGTGVAIGGSLSRAAPGAAGRTAGAALRIGALATLRQIERAPVVRDDWPLLADAVSSIASVQTKVMGTAVGNLCVGTPASDVAPALYALDARVRMSGTGGDRELPIEEFFVDVGRTAVGPHEIVTEIVVPATTGGSTGAFLKLSKTAEDIAKVNCAVMLTFTEGICTQARIALGCVAPTPLRAREAEDRLAGRLLGDAQAAEAAEAACEAVSPITDVRSTASYRREMVRVLVRDALLRAASRTVPGKEA